MAVKLSQSMKQQQSLMMTPQLQQAIKLLTLTHMEMTDMISSEMVENPMLEEISPGEKTEDYSGENLEKLSKETSSEDFKEDMIMSNQDDSIDWQQYVDSYNSTSYGQNMATPDFSEAPNYENMVSKGMSLADHLEWQLRMEELTEDEWEVATKIIHNINDDGYLSEAFDEIIEDCKLDREACLDMLRVVQNLDPVGCGAENLTDCLLAQAQIAEERSPLLEKIIRSHLTDLKNRDYKKITEATGVGEEQIIETAKLLHNFHRVMVCALGV